MEPLSSGPIVGPGMRLKVSGTLDAQTRDGSAARGETKGRGAHGRRGYAIIYLVGLLVSVALAGIATLAARAVERFGIIPPWFGEVVGGAALALAAMRYARRVKAIRAMQEAGIPHSLRAELAVSLGPFMYKEAYTSEQRGYTLSPGEERTREIYAMRTLPTEGPEGSPELHAQAANDGTAPIEIDNDWRGVTFTVQNLLEAHGLDGDLVLDLLLWTQDGDGRPTPVWQQRFRLPPQWRMSRTISAEELEVGDHVLFLELHARGSGASGWPEEALAIRRRADVQVRYMAGSRIPPADVFASYGSERAQTDGSQEDGREEATTQHRAGSDDAVERSSLPGHAATGETEKAP